MRDSIRASLPGADANVPNSVLRVLSDNQGALCHLTLQYIDWLALQLLPDTAETEWLDRHGQIWLVNADGSTGRKMATLAHGKASFTATINGSVIPAGTQLQSGVNMPPESESRNNVVAFEALADITTSSSGSVEGDIRALDPGSFGNLPPGSSLSMVTPIPGVNQIATVVALTGGTDTETDEQLRARILRRIQQPPMGGAAYDYEAWALAVPGVTRAWASPNEMGLGTVTVRFLMDDLRADDDGWPQEEDIIAVADYLDQKRPVAVKDCYVVAPIKQFLDIMIADLVPDTEEVRAEIEQSLRDMLLVEAAPGQRIFAAWVNYAIMSAPSVVSFKLVTDDDYVMPSPGHMAVLSTIDYQESDA
ncbi:baseplate J/gp47 family protein [Bradyrhizobium sp. BRP22]|uniref:baseplate J/gp47 family protein n=1 Tax=Bradyrhizobium sp. BRP22 TaxID=2793821 RepID=UPI001CD3F042|nr:baseplate J/gp47 family protein [Bradyrhizobium sp. BRP22]